MSIAQNNKNKAKKKPSEAAANAAHSALVYSNSRVGGNNKQKKQTTQGKPILAFLLHVWKKCLVMRVLLHFACSLLFFG